VIQTVDLSKELDPAEAQILYKSESSQAIDAARRTPLFDVFLKFSRTPHWRVTPAPSVEGASQVEAVDLRFGFTAIALVDGRNGVLQTTFRYD
jgi:hypothetical protein